MIFAVPRIRHVNYGKREKKNLEDYVLKGNGWICLCRNICSACNIGALLCLRIK